MTALYGRFDPKEFRELIFNLLYVKHGGSGLAITYADLMDLPLNELQLLCSRMFEEREKEHRQLKTGRT